MLRSPLRVLRKGLFLPGPAALIVTEYLKPLSWSRYSLEVMLECNIEEDEDIDFLAHKLHERYCRMTAADRIFYMTPGLRGMTYSERRAIRPVLLEVIFNDLIMLWETSNGYVHFDGRQVVGAAEWERRLLDLLVSFYEIPGL